MLRHLGALLIAVLGTLGVFLLSLGMNAQVQRKQPEVATVVQVMVAAPRSPNAASARKQRASPTKQARRAAPAAGPLLRAGLGGLDFGLERGSDAALEQATAALVAEMGAEVQSEETVDVPPNPTSRTPPAWPARARALGQTGSVTLSFVVDIDGSVQDLHVVASEPPGVFDDAAVEAVRAWHFEPGRDEGAPVAVRVRQILRFELE